jgi:serine/arginine repetitive matrix protein 2
MCRNLVSWSFAMVFVLLAEVLVRIPVFTRPPWVGRSCSRTRTSMRSHAETPPLSISDGYSSFSEGSQSSIDLSHVNYMLSNVTHPLSNATFDRVRPRARSYGHQQCISQARASRTSIYETIEEEFTTSLSLTSSLQSLPGPATNNIQLPDSATKTIGHTPVFVADPETASVDSVSLWDDERGITVLCKYYALHDKVEDTVTESQRVWLDTPFSVFAVQCEYLLPVYYVVLNATPSI